MSLAPKPVKQTAAEKKLLQAVHYGSTDAAQTKLVSKEEWRCPFIDDFGDRCTIFPNPCGDEYLPCVGCRKCRVGAEIYGLQETIHTLQRSLASS